jgi:hypothetical protein
MYNAADRRNFILIPKNAGNIWREMSIVRYFPRQNCGCWYLRERRDAAAARETEAVDPVAGGRGQGVRAPCLLHYAHIRPLRQRHQDARAHITLHTKKDTVLKTFLKIFSSYNVIISCSQLLCLPEDTHTFYI